MNTENIKTSDLIKLIEIQIKILADCGYKHHDDPGPRGPKGTLYGSDYSPTSMNGIMEIIILEPGLKYYPYKQVSDKQLDNIDMLEDKDKFMDGLLTGVSLGISIITIILFTLSCIFEAIGKS